jgi:hypothetical protein
MAKTFVKDALDREAGRRGAGQSLDVDKARKRVLTLRLDDRSAAIEAAACAAARADDRPRTPPTSRKDPASGGALADALRRAANTANKNGSNRSKPR